MAEKAFCGTIMRETEYRYLLVFLTVSSFGESLR